MLRHAFLIVMSGLFLVPIYIAVVNVFKTREDIFANPLSIPLSRLTFDNILRNISTPSFDLGTAYATSVVLSGLTVALVVAMAAAMSYVISRNRHRLFRYAYLLLLAGLMVPAQVILLPLVQVLSLIILGTSRYYTITIGVYRAVGQYVQKWEDVFAIVFMAIFPVIIFYVIMQKRFVSGLTAGALKA